MTSARHETKSIRRTKGTIGGLLWSVTAVALMSTTTVCLGQAADTTGSDSTSATELPEITARGTWLGLSTEGDVRTYPGARTLVTAEEIKQSGAKSVEDVLRRVPGIQIFDETGIDILPNIGVRGLNPLRSERTMVLVDGVPIAPGPTLVRGCPCSRSHSNPSTGSMWCVAAQRSIMARTISAA